MTQFTIRDLVDFVLLNRSDKVFRDMTEDSIAMQLALAIEEGTCLYHEVEGKIAGLIIAELRREEGVLFVTENLAMNMNNLMLFASIAKRKWPDYKLKWMKNGHYKNHNTDRVYKKLAL